MPKTAKTYSVSLNNAIAEALERTASQEGLSPGLMIAEIIEAHFVDSENPNLAEDAKAELLLLRGLRDEAIEKMQALIRDDGFSADITLRTFQACQSDPQWLRRYEAYIRGNPILPGNPRKTNANQTIGSRIKSKLKADDLRDSSQKILRGRAPNGTIIQTYQMLQIH